MRLKNPFRTIAFKGVFCVYTLFLLFPFHARSQVLPSNTQTVNVVSGTGLTIKVNEGDSASVIHMAQAGTYYASDALYRNLSAGSILNFKISLKVFVDRSKDSLVTYFLTGKDKMAPPAGNIDYATGIIWAFSDGKTIYLNSYNKYLPGSFYPLIKKNGHYYYKAYNGPDPSNSSILGGLAIGLGTGFMFGNVGIGLSSFMPMMHSFSRRKLPGHHLVYLEYFMKTGVSVELQSSPL